MRKDQQNIFDSEKTEPLTKVPLAEKLRPHTLSELKGQEKLLSQGSMLTHMIESNDYHSFILWGPPGTGKTTIAKIIEETSHMTVCPFQCRTEQYQ